MQWVTWDQSAVCAILCNLLVLLLRRLPRTKVRSGIISWCTELALISGHYTLWRLAMTLPLDHVPGAIERVSITGLPMTHACDRLTRTTEGHLGNHYEALVRSAS